MGKIKTKRGRAAAWHLLPISLFLFAISGNAQEPEKHVVLHIEDEGKFEVLHSRAESTSTGAVLFGLIGAGIEEGHRSSEDTKREEAILVHIPDDACHSYLIEEFTAKMEAKGFGVSVVFDKAGRNSGDSYVVRLKIDACGYRMVDTIDKEMAAYITAQYLIFKPQQKITGKLEEVMLVGREQRTWETWMSEFEAAVYEFRDTKKRAGGRLANKVIYMK